jgi:hypothetical protein
MQQSEQVETLPVLIVALSPGETRRRCCSAQGPRNRGGGGNGGMCPLPFLKGKKVPFFLG